MAKQQDDPVLAERFANIAAQLDANEAQIVDELNSVQGASTDVGGYYLPDDSNASAAMRPSTTLNRIVASF